ncbi:hypothetical protein SLS60_011899 [Paraconiothyrium brasiliense]|uniref:Uncharacterized protein n=1 Tax=Paraconiothyrium brasiliense TaxID=300254 RepID=A0ABR3QI35_9PLEO
MFIVEKPSALLDVKDEEQIPVNANHEEMCKFGEREDGVYERVFKRVRRMMKDRKTSISDVSLTKTRMTNPAKRSYDEDGSFPHSKRARATLYSPSDHNLRRYYGDESDTSDDSDDNDGGGDSDASDGSDDNDGGGDSDTSDGSDDNDGGGDSDTSDGADDGDDLDNSNMGRGWQDEDDIHLDSDEDY